VIHGIYSAVSGSLSAQTKLDAIADNLANASTPGFKATLLLQRADHAGKGPVMANGVPTPINRGKLQTDFSQGPIQADGDPLHVALQGKGFLVVETPRGERLTRRGTLTVDASGNLATSDGMRVQGDGGDISLAAALRSGGAVAISSDGTVRVGNTQVGKLRLVNVGDPQALAREGSGLFAPAKQALVDADPTTLSVRQGALEGANITPIQSLVALIETMRGYETYMNTTNRLDQVAAKSISDVGRV
jgi:flagellar basal-body rod protein FlgF